VSTKQAVFVSSTSASDGMANLGRPPPPPCMEVRIDAKGFIFIGVMPLWHEFHHGCKFRLPEQFPDTFQDIPMEDVEHLSSDYDLILFELTLTWEAINHPIELIRGCV